ncbi:Icc-related predicted phosphoesterase [Flavobacterium sp. PL11]|jgi:Icc-related predicted phosphoesterase|uniref:metallophosphoesterase family protein n=1 Tax=Flavobacterium sp. PL11 TaxID=3071717 RepID=UPI002E0205B7|nr:Icc-related predicted phosphoesterase [Flavobacterium sp. PL11]
MTLTLISDTHFKHNQLKLAGGDMLIHSGDLCGHGTEGEVLAFLRWFEEQPYKHKIFIAGNHDWFFEGHSKSFIDKIIPPSIHYLNDSGIEIEGLKIWGSPIQPTFYDWAFNRKRGPEINKHWKLIPKDTDILITHGPPLGILDKTASDYNAGCEILLKKVDQIKPKLHVFGHIHEDYGMIKKGKTIFANASLLNLKYQMVNAPIIIEI